MAVKVGINGFGRIGRQVLKAILESQADALEVVAIMGLAENVVDAHSVLPGDIFKARNGKTVQIENTDAEGRLTLTDALSWAALPEPVTAAATPVEAVTP